MTTPPPPDDTSDGGGAVPPPPPPPPPPVVGVVPQPVHPQFPQGFPPYPPPARTAAGGAGVPPAGLPGGEHLVASPLLYPGAPVTLQRAVAEGRPVRAAGWGLTDVLVMLALWLFFSLLALTIAAVLLGDAEISSGPAIVLALAMPWVGLAGWPIAVSFWKGNGPVIDYGLTSRLSDVGWGLLYGLGALVSAAIIAAVTTAFFGEFDSAAGEVGSSLDSLPILIIFALLVGFGAPIVEELAFRGLVFGALAKRRLAPWLTILLSALAFSLFHFEPIRIPLLLSTGLILGLARYHRGSTTVPIVAHMVNNVPAAVALVFMSS